MEQRQTYSTLTLMGVAPFLACALLPFIGVEEIAGLGQLDQLANSYGMAILCFLTGVHWATQLYEEEAAPFNLFIGSNAIFLAVWITYVFADLPWALGTQLVAFPLLLAIDSRLSRGGLISAHYLLMRGIATVLACFSLLLILAS